VNAMMDGGSTLWKKLLYLQTEALQLEDCHWLHAHACYEHCPTHPAILRAAARPQLILRPRKDQSPTNYQSPCISPLRSCQNPAALLQVAGCLRSSAMQQDLRWVCNVMPLVACVRVLEACASSLQLWVGEKQHQTGGCQSSFHFPMIIQSRNAVAELSVQAVALGLQAPSQDTGKIPSSSPAAVWRTFSLPLLRWRTEITSS
jgi:hypothetical protein